MNVSDVLELEFTGLGLLGEGIAEHEGLLVYVPAVLPGERARVRIRTVHSKSAVAELEELLRAAPERRTARCELFGRCSGCQLQHLDYPEQLEFKRRIVAEQMQRAGLTIEVAPVVPAADPWNYRNHARFTIDRGGRIGFVQRRGRRFLPVEYCHIMDGRINEALQQLQGRLQGMTQCNMRVGQRTGQLAIVPRLPFVEPASGQTRFNEVVAGKSFQVSVPAFFQVNSSQADRLIELLRRGLGRGRLLVDAYAGVGTFAVALASQFDRVIAIEESGPAVKDALVNAEGIANVEIRIGRTEAVLPELVEPIDSLVLDPPRKGCQPQLLASLRKIAPACIAYVSCNPESLARDLVSLLAPGEPGECSYRIESLQPVDMFPQTRHVEVLAIMRRA